MARVIESQDGHGWTAAGVAIPFSEFMRLAAGLAVTVNTLPWLSRAEKLNPFHPCDRSD